MSTVNGVTSSQRTTSGLVCQIVPARRNATASAHLLPFWQDRQSDSLEQIGSRKHYAAKYMMRIDVNRRSLVSGTMLAIDC